MPDEPKAESSPAPKDTGDTKAPEQSLHVEDPDDDTNVPWNKDRRFQDFIQKRKTLKEYESLGTPEQIAGYVQQLQSRVDKLEADREPREPKSDEQKQRETELKQARKQLREIDPDIEKIESLEQQIAAQNESLEIRAFDETASVMKAAGLSTAKDDVVGMSDMLANIIGNDRVLLAEYRGGNPREAVRLAWKKLGTIAKAAGSDRSAVAETQRTKEKQTNLPKPHGAAGTPGTPSRDTTTKRGLAGAFERSKSYLKGLE